MPKVITVDGKSKDELLKETVDAVAKIAYEKMMNEEYKEDYEVEEDDKDRQRYINDDLMPKNPTRKMYHMQKEMMPAILNVFYKKLSSGNLPYNYYFEIDGGHQLLWQLINNDETLQNDKREIYVTFGYLICQSYKCPLYYKNGFGNNAKGEPLLGLQEIGDFSFIGFEMGHDGEYPVFGIIYFDGSKLRLYYPRCGNMINFDFNSSFGEERCGENFKVKYADYIKEQLHNEYHLMDNEIMGLSDYYAAKYELTKDSIYYGFNWDLIKQDILATFEIEKDNEKINRDLIKEINKEWFGAETIFERMISGN